MLSAFGLRSSSSHPEPRMVAHGLQSPSDEPTLRGEAIAPRRLICSEPAPRLKGGAEPEAGAPELPPPSPSAIAPLTAPVIAAPEVWPTTLLPWACTAANLWLSVVDLSAVLDVQVALTVVVPPANEGGSGACPVSVSVSVSPLTVTVYVTVKLPPVLIDCGGLDPASTHDPESGPKLLIVMLNVRVSPALNAIGADLLLRPAPTDPLNPPCSSCCTAAEHPALCARAACMPAMVTTAAPIKPAVRMQITMVAPNGRTHSWLHHTT